MIRSYTTSGTQDISNNSELHNSGTQDVSNNSELHNFRNPGYFQRLGATQLQEPRIFPTIRSYTTSGTQDISNDSELHLQTCGLIHQDGFTGLPTAPCDRTKLVHRCKTVVNVRFSPQALLYFMSGCRVIASLAQDCFSRAL